MVHLLILTHNVSCQNTPPLVSYGKMKDKKEGPDKNIKDYIDRITTPIFSKVLQETHDNPMMVGRVQKSKEIKWLWQPHNYRLYFNFNKKNFKVVTPSLYKYPTFKYQLMNYGSEHHFNNFMDCRIIIRKNSAEIINKSYKKQWVLCTAHSNNQIKEIIDKRVSKLNNQGINALKELIRLCGGISDCKILKVKGEHGIHGIDYLDRIPEDMIIHDTIFKKVYKGKVEFYDPASIKNTVSNSALKEFAPEITASIDNLGNQLIPTIKELSQSNKELNKSIQLEITNKKLHQKVLNSMDKTLKDIRDSLPKRGLLKWL